MEKFINIQLFAGDEVDDAVEDEFEFEDVDDDEYDTEESDDDDDTVEDDTEEDAEENVDDDAENAEEEEPTKEDSTPPVDVEELAREAYERGKREGRVAAMAGKKNHYTDEPITDEVDLDIYETMSEIEKKGGDPIADYPKYIAAQERARRQGQAASSASVAKTQSDVREFIENHKEVSLKDLAADERFQKFAKGKLGNIPLSEIYDDYKDITAEMQSTAQKTAKNIVAKQKSSPGALSGGRASGAMTEKEINKLFTDSLRGKLD